MQKMVIASNNEGKIREIKEIFKNINLDILSLKDIDIDISIPETGSTFKENSYIKAKGIYKICNEIVLADDSGLVVDALNGAPGIYSARFAGENSTDEEKNRKLLDMLKGISFKKRTARFVCAVTVILKDGSHITATGTCEGIIALKPEGENGFGYDPLFFVPEYNMTTAQMEPSLKHKISHRGKALRKMAETLTGLL